ncbi:universal stress protein [Natronobacterium gregoryi]|uniref:Universal stress protein n=2 Tax=Natronobacterium gregoryi TaxID=44930 RepID=L0AFM8_NATGS|nr:universal stress protein [Natronobacterium gregoryi]AFZ71957.1 universal stress protein UspA-like protein [Natronobacterium gregoryi SP2]ELY62546.1 UspA domain-containing protein [Natronobacterium gregoryi SP2]PLK20733.1 universal stress protein [Natronobacterium gregoryi SP2]SFJ12780.1 Nucleotide-binding universal stress protein, UspA family [Natronobacterium gregoryi]
MYDDILIATDGSDAATTAATAGIALARTLGATVHALSVVEDETDETRRKRRREHAETVANRAIDAGCEADSAVLTGQAASEIREYAATADVDVIVVGTHGRTGLRQALLGSVALEVIRDARLPVLTVGSDATWDCEKSPIEDLCLATDGATGATAATSHALSVADACDARLHALYAVDVDPDSPELHEAFEKHGERTTAEVAEQAQERGLETSQHVEHGPATDVVLEYTDAETVDLLVMGTESKSTLERLVVGSVSQRVVPNADVPVLTVRTVESS